MNDLKKEVIEAQSKGNLLGFIDKMRRGGDEERNNLNNALINLHNDGQINVVTAFKEFSKQTGIDFFLNRHVFEKILPQIDAPVLAVMECVLHLANEAGQDGAAGLIFNPFIDFCSADRSRPEESLKHIEASNKLVDFLAPTIISGARVDEKYYLNEAVRLSNHQNIEFRKRAIFAIGRIEYSQTTTSEMALCYLESSFIEECDDQVLANIINSAFGLLKHCDSQHKRIANIITRALEQGNDFSLHTASELFGFHFNELPETLLDSLLSFLLNVQPKNLSSISNICHGLDRLFKHEDPTKGIEFFETYLLKHKDSISLDAFGNIFHAINGNTGLLNKLLTRWFFRGDRILCEVIRETIHKAYDHDMLLGIDQSELVSKDLVGILFVARKAVGYLFFKPVTSASIIISLIQATKDKETLQQLGALLLNPLLINYTGKVKDYLTLRLKGLRGKNRATVKKALSSIDKYLEDLKSTGLIPELHPSQAQREAQQRHFSRLFSESMKAAEKDSVFLSMTSKSILLYGRKSVHYVHSPDGQTRRMETPLQSHGTQVEVARLENIDPFELDYMIRVFRAEQRVA